jgi:hypothetical protein
MAHLLKTTYLGRLCLKNLIGKANSFLSKIVIFFILNKIVIVEETTDLGYVLNVIGKANSFHSKIRFFIFNKIVIVEETNHLSKQSVPLLIAHFHQRLLE